MRNVLPDVIAAQTVNNPSQIVVNSKGQITSLSNSAGSTDIVAWMRDTGPSTTAAQSINATTETVLRLTNTTTVTWLSLASNVFTVAAGTYEIDAVVPWYVPSGTVNPVTVLLYDETASAVLATSSDQQGTDDDQGWIPLKAVFTVAVETQLSLRIFSTIAITIGDPVGNGYDETFTQVLLRRLGA